MAAVCGIGVAVPASAAEPVAGNGSAAFAEPDANDWGTVVPNAGCAQSNAWIARVEGIGGYVNTALFESHAPATPTAPATAGGGSKLINLTIGGFGLGKGSALFTRALHNKMPTEPGVADSKTIDKPCAAYAESGGATVDVGLPYVSNPLGNDRSAGQTAARRKVPLSPIGVHVEGITTSAIAEPGKPVALRGGAAAGYISSFGKKIINIPPLWPVNFGVRIPADYSLPVFAQATTNEHVTTDAKGRPTLDAKGKYFYDPSATSGYVTGIHASVLGSNAADANVAHSAVIRDGGDTPESPECAAPTGRCARPATE